MTRHPTPTLSYGAPPAYPHLASSDVEELVEALQRTSAHAPDEATARAVLARLGMTEVEVERCIRFAETGALV